LVCRRENRIWVVGAADQTVHFNCFFQPDPPLGQPIVGRCRRKFSNP
jgi:hypothetical protein